MTTEDSATQQSVSSVRGRGPTSAGPKKFVVTFDTTATDPCGFCKKTGTVSADMSVY